MNYPARLIERWQKKRVLIQHAREYAPTYIDQLPITDRLAAFLYPYRRLMFWSVVVVIVFILGVIFQDREVYSDITLFLIAVSSAAAVVTIIIATKNDWSSRGIGIFFNKWGAVVLFSVAWLDMHGIGEGVGRYERAAIRAFYIVGSILSTYGFIRYWIDQRRERSLKEKTQHPDPTHGEHAP